PEDETVGAGRSDQVITGGGGVPDRLDEVLEALSIKQEPTEGAFPPPPPSIAGTAAAGVPLVNESLTHQLKSSSTTPPLPPPPADIPTMGGGPPPPSSASGPASLPPPKAMQIASSNPFKRTGGRSHAATPGLSGASASSVPALPTPPAFYQQPTLLQPAAATPEESPNVGTLTPENQEILVEPTVPVPREQPHQVENQEIAPSNDRNQYLQTGHLSEDGYGVEVPSPAGNGTSVPPSGHPRTVSDANDGRLPPPGLSRYVPGQNEQQPEPLNALQPMAAAGQSYPEPPPGLDRMVPGMDLQNASDLSRERQADGEVSDATPSASSVTMPSATVMRNEHVHHQHHHHHNHHGGGHHHHHERVDMSDRNLYRVPGEDDNHNHQQQQQQQQRVVPGGRPLENERPIAPVVPSSTALVGGPVATLDIPDEQRELVMDGENPDDRREESLVGGNAEPPIAVATGAGAPAGSVAGSAELESNTTADASRVAPPEPSNTSTADDSDKGGFYGAASAKGARREDDTLRRSNKSKSSRDRYDTEDSDYSEHERRRRERDTGLGGGGVGGNGGGTADQSGSHQRHEQRTRHSTRTGGDRDKDKGRKDNGRDRDRDRGDRERDRDRDRDYDYRDRERNRYDRDRERYGGRSSKYDRDSRYETDGSKYETERSTRYEKDDKRYTGSARDDYYRKRDERGPADDSRGGGAGAGSGRDRDTIERRQRKEKERSDRYRGDERRKDDRYRDGDKRRDRHDRRYDPEDYRTGSRNGTERDRARDSRDRDDRKEKDRKYMGAAAAGGYGVAGAAGAYGPSSGYYDPYSYYAQHQQYYEQLRRTNPQAYAEWYRTYYAQMQASQMQRDLLTTDGRESVHSGRSSANDKERFNRTTPFMHPPGLYNPEEYHRHFNNQSLPSAAVATASLAGPGSLLDQTYLTDVSGQPSSLPPMFHHANAYQQQALLHQQQQHHHQRANTSLAMDRTYRSEAGGYFQPRIDQIDASSIKPVTANELSMMEPERLTPRKFPEIHPIVNVSAGLLISTKNRLTMNGMADTVKIFSLGFHDASRKLFQCYPGPLVKGVTHKKSVIEFCEEQLRQGPPYSGALALIKSRGNSINSLHSSSLAAGVNRSSFALLWNYIILLLRQNGTFVGTDISELLMRNKEEYPFESVQASVTRSANISGRNSSLSQAAADGAREADAQQHDGADSGGEDAAVHDDAAKELLPDATPKALSELEITDKFRSYLLYGNIGEALEWATEHNLWGHALFLASKVDSRQHANVMMKFANKLTLNDPLQTLYQLLSGRTPASVTSVLDEKWGDWRPHLAMLMSNSSAKPELIKKSITTLGDTLLNRGDLYAAHFCYLLSDVAFGRFADVKQDAVAVNNGAVRLVLLGAAHHNRNFRELSTNESIMMTEIYEYARSLNEDRYSITELQRYKYLLACRMLDQGMQLKCLLYMEQIAEQVQHDPYRFDAEFVRKVYTLGDRLKYYDPVMEKALDESVDNTGRGNIYANVEDPQWLKQLNEILLTGDSTSNGASNFNNANEGQLAYDYGSYGYGVDQSQTGTAVGQEQSSSAEAYPSEPNDINKQFNEINQQLGQLTLQYNDQQQQQQQQQQQHQQQEQPYQPLQQNAAPYETNPIPPAYDQGYESINQQSLVDGAAGEQAGIQHPESYEQQQQQFSQYNSYEQHQQHQQHQPEQQHPGGANFFTPAPPTNNEPVEPAVQAYDGGYWGAAGNSELRTQEHSWQQHHHYHHDEDDEHDEEGDDDEEDDEHHADCDRSSCSPSPGAGTARPVPGGGGPTFDYRLQRDACAPKPMISMPNSVAKRPGFGDETEDERSSQPMGAGGKPPQPTNASQAKKGPALAAGKDGKPAAGGAGGGAQGSGWFGGIWNKFSLKPKNQMILPDDKNPKIVWDEVSKRWVNTDENEAETEAYKPPPKMSDLVPGAPGVNPPQMGPPHGAVAGGPRMQTHVDPAGPGVQAFQQGPTHATVAPTPQPLPNSGVGGLMQPTAPSGAAPAAASVTSAVPASQEPSKVPTLQSNMYKMQRNRTLKRSYVDVFNPSGAAPSKPTEPVLAPAVPTLPNAPGGFFVPGGTPNPAATANLQGAPSNDGSEGMPQFYNPNQFGGAAPGSY
uniref:Sec16 Sec23-binding domain-containing protein n=1 Tax=Anopheles dirus TaxID=7168 RepID=A0A182MXH7_9DIPT